MTVRVLAGDLGGTKALLQIAECDATGYRVAAEARFESAQYADFTALVREFLTTLDAGAIEAACFGIAGPVRSVASGQTADVTNLPWRIDSLVLARALGIPRVRLINDFQAVGYGIEALTEQDVLALQPGRPEAQAPCAVIGAGTGLGQGLLVWHGDHYEAIATEGGHADFAPTDELQTQLLAYLRARFGRVSYERILSGPGLVNVYGFFRDRGEPTTLDLDRLEDAPAAISGAAHAGTDRAAIETLRLFVKVYGAQAGNLALTALATGGVYVAGGIAPKILPALQSGEFMRAFLDKGRLRTVLEAIPVQVILNQRAGLVGAALAARRLNP